MIRPLIKQSIGQGPVRRPGFDGGLATTNDRYGTDNNDFPNDPDLPNYRYGIRSRADDDTALKQVQYLKENGKQVKTHNCYTE